MKFFKYLIVILFVINLNISNAQDKELQRQITKNLICLICQG